MKYTKLGRSGMVVSRICMGTHHLDAPEQMDRHVENVLYAWSKGVNFFETGTTYGEGFSEQILGQAFAQMKKGELPFHVMSKTHAGEPSDFRRDLENSLKRLGLEQIDVFTCLWGVKSGVEYDEAKAYGALEEMEKARQEGLIRHIGVSAHMKNAEMAHLAQDFSFDIIEEGFNVVNDVKGFFL